MVFVHFVAMPAEAIDDANTTWMLRRRATLARRPEQLELV